MEGKANLTSALADRYRIERELGQGGMVRRSVAEATTRLLSLKRHDLGGRSHLSDTRRVAASAADRLPRYSLLTIVS
jgi:hypothetical protein